MIIEIPVELDSSNSYPDQNVKVKVLCDIVSLGFEDRTIMVNANQLLVAIEAIKKSQEKIL